jgi:hypothetical protein
VLLAMHSEPSEDAKKVRLRFIQPTRGLKIHENLGSGISFSPQFYLTNDRSTIKKLIDRSLAVGMGMHFMEDVLKADAVIYREDNLSCPEFDHDQFGVSDFVHYGMEFLLSLWMVNDHAIDLLPAVLKISPPDQDSTHQIHWFGQINFDAMGNSQPVEFSLEEIRIACEYNQGWVQKLTRESNQDAASLLARQAQTNFQPKSSRLFRFLCLLDRARTVPDLGVRLGLFCSAMECIFSSGKTEITHRVSERAAFFLESEKEKRKRVYENVTDAYGIRSSELHGSQIEEKKKLQNLPMLCKQTDEILRQTFKKVILDPDNFHRFNDSDSTSEKNIKEYFHDMLFSSGNQKSDS